jgi:hypothetical protein
MLSDWIESHMTDGAIDNASFGVDVGKHLLVRRTVYQSRDQEPN